MYNLDSRVQVLTVSHDDFSSVSVLAADASVREAFALARPAIDASVVTSDEYGLMETVFVVILPVGESLPADEDAWPPYVLMYEDEDVPPTFIGSDETGKVIDGQAHIVYYYLGEDGLRSENIPVGAVC